MGYQKVLHNQDMKFAELLWEEHCYFHEGKEARVEFANGEWCSIIGGGEAYGDGINSFELMTSVDTPNVVGWLSKDDLMIRINKVKNMEGKCYDKRK